MTYDSLRYTLEVDESFMFLFFASKVSPSFLSLFTKPKRDWPVFLKWKQVTVVVVAPIV